MNTHVESPRERATTDITSALVSLEEVEATLTAGGYEFSPMVQDVQERLERLKEAVEGA